MTFKWARRMPYKTPSPHIPINQINSINLRKKSRKKKIKRKGGKMARDKEGRGRRA